MVICTYKQGSYEYFCGLGKRATAAEELSIRDVAQPFYKAKLVLNDKHINIPYLSFLVPVKNEFVTTISPAVHLK